MKRGIIMSLAVVALWWGAGLNFAGAQGVLGQPPVRIHPTVNPAINIGTGGAFGYYGLIKPQTDATRSILELQQTLNRMNPDGSLQGQVDQQKQTGLGGLQTGHAATFFNYSHYYPLTPPMGGSGLGGTASFGQGLGGLGQGLGGNYGVGATGTGFGTFFPATMNQGFRR